MLNLRLRPGKDNGTIDSAKSKALKTLEITLGTALNSSADLRFKVSRDDFVPEQFPFVVILEHSIDGGAYTQPATNSVFIVEKDSDDSKDAGKVATYEAIDFVTWLLQGALIQWHNSAKDGKRTWYESGNKAASAGWILAGMLNESKNSQTFPALTWGFTNAKDSDGNNWVAGDKSIIAWELTKNLSEVLNQLTDDGLCEWSSTGVRLNLYRMGTMGNDYPDVVIGGRGFSAVPVSTDSSGMYSHIRAIPDGLPWQTYSSNTSLVTRFGRRHIVLTQSGIKDVASSKKNAEPYVAAGKVLQRQEGYEWTPSDNTAHPYRDFNIGDQVTAHSRGGKQLRRVTGIAIRQSGQEPAQVTTMVGDFIKTRAAKLRDRLGSVSVGGIIGGSGSAFPSTPGPSPLAPIAPVGVLVTGNTGEWLSDGSARANVTVQWAPTTEATDGSEIDVVEYEVWSRTPSGFLKRDTATRDTQVQISSWVPGELRLVAVRAKSARGIWSDYSTEFSVTPVIPASIIPKAPEAVAATSNVGSWTAAGPMSTIELTITPVTESTDDTPVTIKEYEIWVDGNPVMRTPTPSATLTQPIETARDYRARALSTLDVWGDLSPTLTVTGALPSVAVRNPTAPVLTTGAGNAFARWDGAYVSGGTAGAHRVDVEARIGTGAWAVQGTLVGAGQQIVTLGSIGDVVAVRLRAYDQLGRLTGTSVEATVTVVGIEIPDLDQSVSDMLADMETDISDALDAANAAQGTAGNAQTAADQAAADALAAAGLAAGKGRVWAQDVAPPAGRTFEWAGAANASESIEKLDGAEVRRNLCKRPAAASGWSYWPGGSGGMGTLTYLTGSGHPIVDTFVRQTITAPGTGVTYNNHPRSQSADVAAGTVYSIGVSVRTSKNSNITQARTEVKWFDSSGTMIAADLLETPFQGVGIWHHLQGLITAPAGAVWVSVESGFAFTGTTSIGDTFDATAAFVIAGSGNYFDGSTPDDRSYDLWINTTDGGNAPHRWINGAWQVVTDKAATDAAAAAVTAQDRADEAYDEALSAATAAGNAQASADGKTTNWYQNDAPAGTAHKVGDTWFDTNDGNRIYHWNGSWVAAQFGTNAISDTAINAAKLAANAVTEGKILNGAITNDKLNPAVRNAITTAQSTADNAQTAANSAQTVASAAQTAAGNAQDDADQAILDAAAAAGIAGGKADVLIQNTAPPAAMRKATTLWIDTTGGANTPKRWVSGTTWAAVTDKAATDAAAAAATAQSAAGAAHSRADDAHTIASGAATAASAAASAASAAQTAANNAQTTANGKNKVVRSTADASSPGNYVAGDQWWKYSGTQITAMWIHSGSAWVSQTLTDSVITNLNAGSITAGTISAARLSATNIKAVLVNAGAIQAANIAAGAITAASGIIADAAIGTAKIIDGSITTAKIENLAVTNAQIANGTIQNAKIANLDAAKITTGELDADRIAANSITASKLLVGDFENIFPDRYLSEWHSSWGPGTLVTDMNPPAGGNVLLWEGGASSGHASTQPRIQSETGDEFLIEYTSKGTNGGTAATISLWSVPQISSEVIEALPDDWVRRRTIVRVQTPREGGERIVYSKSAAGGAAYTDIVIRRRNGGELIVDGAVKAHHVTMDEGFADKFWANEGNFGKIAVDHVTPYFGDSLNISANESVTIVINRQDEQDGYIQEAQDTADLAQSAAAVASSDAAAAQAAVTTLAQGRVLSAEQALDELSEKIDTYENSFSFESDGLHIRESKTAAAEMVLTSAGARLISDGVTASEWNQGQLIVAQIIAVGGQLGNHIIDSSIPGHTTFRPLI